MTDYSKITALYSRLSVGDEDRDGGESNSIQNQKIFLENYARGQHLTNIRHYIDDDESGRFFDRSAYSEQVTEELSSVRKQLEKMEQEKADKTLKATVRKAVESLEQQCQKMKQQLFEIKTEVKAKAFEIVAEAKAKGKAALHKVSEFLGIKDKLESVRDNVRKSIAETEHTINKLDAFGNGMREAGQKIANTFRTFADKETVDYFEKEKKFSKTELVKKPFEAKKKLYQRMEQHLDEALDKVERLAKEPERTKDVEMAEPSMLGAVAEQEFQYGADAFEAYQQTAKAETAVVSEVKVQEVKGKSR